MWKFNHQNIECQILGDANIRLKRREQRYSAWMSSPKNLAVESQLMRHKGIEMPWGTKHQLCESTESTDCNLAEAIALCNGSIVSKQLISTGNLEMREMRLAGAQVWDWEVDFNKFATGEIDLNLHRRVDNLEKTIVEDIFFPPLKKP